MEVQQALRNLRTALGLTQQDLAVKLGKAVATVARWETSRPPRGAELAEILAFAVQANQPAAASVLARALGDDLQMRGQRIPWTIEEGLAADVLFLAMRNRHVPEVQRSWRRAKAALLTAFRLIAKTRRAMPDILVSDVSSQPIYALSLEDLEILEDEVKLWESEK